MRQSQLFVKTQKKAPKDEKSSNAQLLTQAGFTDKLMAGSFTLLPLGFRVKEKIEQIIREEIDKTGANEILMPLLHPKEIWNETGRWDSAKGVMYQFKKDKKEYALSFTHEEIFLDLIRKMVSGYKDFPVKVYHFSTKFRHEPRVKSGVLRGREFLMKDLYSAHTSAANLDEYYWEVAASYIKIFKKMGLDSKIVEAGGGVFTKSHTHEFQVFCDQGEDTIYHCQNCDFAQNKEIANVKAGDKCPKCGEKIIKSKGIEVGNIFNFGTVYSEKMGVYFTDKDGVRKPVHLASYGIGVTRLIGTLVELFHDEKGIVWPEEVAPFKFHLLSLDDSTEVKNSSERIYQDLQKQKIEVLYDDRITKSAGEKFVDADLIGIPFRLVVSKKTIEKDAVEIKKRNEKEMKLLKRENLLNALKSL